MKKKVIIVAILVLVSSLVLGGCAGRIFQGWVSQEEYDRVCSQLALLEEQNSELQAANENLHAGMNHSSELLEHLSTVLTDWAENQTAHVPLAPPGLDKCTYVYELAYDDNYHACVDANLQNVDCYSVAENEARRAWEDCKNGYPTDYSYLDAFWDKLY